MVWVAGLGYVWGSDRQQVDARTTHATVSSQVHHKDILALKEKQHHLYGVMRSSRAGGEWRRFGPRGGRSIKRGVASDRHRGARVWLCSRYYEIFRAKRIEELRHVEPRTAAAAAAMAPTRAAAVGAAAPPPATVAAGPRTAGGADDAADKEAGGVSLLQRATRAEQAADEQRQRAERAEREIARLRAMLAANEAK